MKRWQRFWLSFLIVYSLLHLARDILQDLGVKVFLSTFLTANSYKYSSWMSNASTYFIALLEIVLSFLILKRGKFDIFGYLTIFIAAITVFVWAENYFAS